MAYEECSQCTFVWPVLSTMLDMVCRYYDGCNINAAGSCVKFMADSLRHHSLDDDYISCRLVLVLTHSLWPCNLFVRQKILRFIMSQLPLTLSQLVVWTNLNSRCILIQNCEAGLGAYNGMCLSCCEWLYLSILSGESALTSIPFGARTLWFLTARYNNLSYIFNTF